MHVRCDVDEGVDTKPVTSRDLKLAGVQFEVTNAMPLFAGTMFVLFMSPVAYMTPLDFFKDDNDMGILIAKIRPEQEIRLKCIAKKGSWRLL